ncbi:MAG TPA: hypothetical protein VH723_01530 [Candidatus Limnocylindrales bacterium]
MELIATVVVVAACTALAFLAMTSANRGAQVVTMMFRSSAELGWPIGVQEDDEFAWNWTTPIRSRPRLPRPEVIDLAPGSGPVGEPVRRHLPLVARR